MYVHAVFFRISVDTHHWVSWGLSSLDWARRFLGISSGLLDPSLARGAGEIQKTIVALAAFGLLVEPPKGRWFCLKRTSRSLFGGWERGKLETPSFLWMDFFFFWDWFNMFCLFSLHSVRKSLFSNSLLRLHWSWPTRLTLWLFNKFKMKQGRKQIFF